MTHITLDLSRLGPDDLILTPNRRLSAWLQRDYNHHQRSRGLKAWQALNAQPLDAWLLDQYNQMAILSHPPLPRLLSPLQVRVLWQKHLSSGIEELGHLEGLIQLSQQARTLICRWNLSTVDWDRGETEENRVFAAAHHQFLDDLQQYNWIDQAGLANVVMDRMAQDKCHTQRVFLHGFNDFLEPQLLRLKSVLEQCGVIVEFSGQKVYQGESGTLSYTDYEAQFGAALAWALQELSANQSGRFAIVVPNLQNLRPHLEKLCVDLAAANPTHLPNPWRDTINITAGVALSSFPLVSHALLMFKAFAGNLRLAEWDILLKSPFFKRGHQQFELSDAFVVWLKGRNRAFLTWSQIHELWSQFASTQALADIAEVDLFSIPESIASSRKQPKSLQYWLRWLQQILDSLGWLSGRTLDSEAYQVNERFQETLQSLTELDSMLDPVDYSVFLNELTQAVKNVTFQPQSETAPVQVMGVLEAAAMNFDGMWVCECESHQWPQPAKPNPLLPRGTLRRFKMPGSGPERELTYAKNILDGFAQAAPTVIFSWGEFQGDTQLLMSPLIDSLPRLDAPETMLDFTTQEESNHQLAAMIITNESDDAGTSLASQHSKGGSGLLRAQSICPFKAYAEFRLNIRDEDDLQDGIKASDRGSLVHRVLESFWRDTRDYASLEALINGDTHLDREINRILDDEMIHFRKDTYLQPEALYSLEKQRTFQTVKQWLINAELNRVPFTVENIEKRQTINLAGLELSLTVDRIDILEDGSRAIIDYKTGLKNTSSWLGERPEEPQLPLYALVNPDRTKGIYFGIIRPEKSDWQGLQDRNTPFNAKSIRTVKTPDSGWNEQVTDWSQTLERLATEYQNGVASVTPVHDAICQFCHLSPVCRIKEQANVSE